MKQNSFPGKNIHHFLTSEDLILKTKIKMSKHLLPDITKLQKIAVFYSSTIKQKPATNLDMGWVQLSSV